MLKTYRIIPFAFILFLFGFTLITVAPVIAQEQWNPSMGMCHNSRPCMIANSCGKQCAVNVRESKGWVNPNSPMPTSTSPSGGEVAELNAKVAELETQLSAANAAQEPLNAKVAELETQLSAANAAQEPLNARIAVLEAENARLQTSQTPVVTEPHAKVTDGQWNPSMGMCHNSRPCMKMNNCGRVCDPDVRESKGWVNPNGTSKPNTKIACKKRGGKWMRNSFTFQLGCREKSQASEASTGKDKCDLSCQFDAEQKLKRDKTNCSKLVQWGQPGYANYVNACTSCSDRVKGKTYAEKCR